MVKLHLTKEEASNLRTVRKVSGYTDASAGKLLSLHRTTIGKIERAERRIPLSLLQEMEEIYKVKIIGTIVKSLPITPKVAKAATSHKVVTKEAAHGNEIQETRGKHTINAEDLEPNYLPFTMTKTIKSGDLNIYVPEKWYYDE